MIRFKNLYFHDHALEKGAQVAGCVFNNGNEISVIKYSKSYYSVCAVLNGGEKYFETSSEKEVDAWMERLENGVPE